MNKLIIVLFIIIFVLILIIVCHFRQLVYNIPIGNGLCAYIYTNDIVPSISNPVAIWNPESWDNKKEYAKYWTKPNKKILQEKFIKSRFKSFYNAKPHNALPVIHFRCSDVPFVKNGHYKLPKKEVGMKILELLKERGYDEVIWLSNGAHRKEECSEKACKDYSDYYKSLLSGITIRDRFDGDLESDFMLMYNSPLVIGIISSSFSMMSKIHDLANYKVVYGDNDKFNYEDIPWSINNVKCLNHEDVETYCDTSKIIDMLNQ